MSLIDVYAAAGRNQWFFDTLGMPDKYDSKSHLDACWCLDSIGVQAANRRQLMHSFSELLNGLLARAGER